MKNGFLTRTCHPYVIARQSLENLRMIEASIKESFDFVVIRSEVNASGLIFSMPRK